MADKKKRMCPNILKDREGKPKCGKEFEFDPAPGEWDGRCPHCHFNVARYDDERDLKAVQDEEAKTAKDAADAAVKGKKKSMLSHLGEL